MWARSGESTQGRKEMMEIRIRRGTMIAPTEGDRLTGRQAQGLMMSPVWL